MISVIDVLSMNYFIYKTPAIYFRQELYLLKLGVAGWLASSVVEEVESPDEEAGERVCSVEEDCAIAGDLELVTLVNGWKVDQEELVGYSASVSKVVFVSVDGLVVEDATLARR